LTVALSRRGRAFASRLVQSLVTLWVLTTVVWLLFRLLPGDPTTALLGTGQLPPDAIAALRLAWALDDPWHVQYLRFFGNLLTGDLGLSFQFREPVAAVLAPALANTLLLMVPSVTLAVLIGVAVGARLGWRRGTLTEAGGNILVLILRSLPAFWIGIVLLMIFAYNLRWFPIGGIRTPAFEPETWVQALPGYDIGIHLVLPVAAAVLYFLADPLMIMRTAMLEARGEDFVAYAEARGLSDAEVMAIARHNALLPVVTYIGIMVSFAFGGQVLLEVVFSWPGMGRLMVNAVLQRDYPVAQAAFLVMAVMVVVLNLLVDLAYSRLDPRIRHA
jgi:peptide/nickel transport system permease protein